MNDITDLEKQIICRYACRERSFKDKASKIYYKNIAKFPESVFIRFMSEVLNDCPDLVLRNKYRIAVCKEGANIFLKGIEGE